MQISPGGSGLRERKRRRTRQTIARVALEIFDRQGFQATTIPQIAEAADVSPRTVSAYFPHKEDLAFPEVDEEFGSLEARMRDRPSGETAIAALGGWIRSWLEDADEDELAIERKTRRRVIRADDSLRAYEHHHTLRAQRIIAAAIAQDLDVSPDDLEPRMAAAATLTVFDLLGEDYDTGDPAEALVVVDRALQFIDGGISALRGAGPSPGPTTDRPASKGVRRPTRSLTGGASSR